MTTINKLDRQDMRGWTSACWWTRPITWSGVRNELEKLAKQHEAAADYTHETEDGYWRRRSQHEARLARLANEQVTRR